MIDVILFVIIGAGAVRGYVKGFVKQLASIVGLIVGLIAAKTLYGALADKLCPSITESMTVAQIVSFVAIWISVPLVFVLLASVLTKALQAVALGGVNRMLGAFSGALKYAFILSLLIGLIEFIDTESTLIAKTKKNESLLYNPMKTFAETFIPTVKELTQQYILNHDDATRRTQQE